MRESRLKFTDKEWLDPVMGKAVRKAEKAADKAEKAQAKIPTKKVIKRELMTDNSNGKIKVKLHFEDMEKKPPSQPKVTDAPTAAVRRQIRREIRDSEDDNVGVEAAGYAADTVDSSANLLQEAHHSAQLQPYRAAARAEKQLEKANLHALQKKAEVEHPTSNPLSRWRQKQAIKRQYAAQKAGRSTVEGSTRAAKEAVKKSEQAVTFVVRHRKGFAAVLGILLILAFLLNAVSSCSMMVEGIGAGIAAGSYAAADDDIVGAEAAYCAMEQALQQKLDHYEQTHDYDEYHYALDDIGHDPYVLTAILSAMHPGEWTLQEVTGTLDMLFESSTSSRKPWRVKPAIGWKPSPGNAMPVTPSPGSICLTSGAIPLWRNTSMKLRFPTPTGALLSNWKTSISAMSPCM